MKKKKRGWIWLVVAVVIVLAGGFVLSRALRPNPAGADAQQYEAVKATRGDMQVSVHGTGSIEAMDTQAVVSGASGKVDTVNVENGDTVKPGDVIATLDASALNDTISGLKEQIIAQDAAIAALRASAGLKTLYAPVDARVVAVYAKEDQDANVPMSAKGALMLLSTDGNMKAEFVPKDGAKLEAGGAIKASIGGKTADGFILTVPDSTTDKAVAVIKGDSWELGADAVIQDAGGSELGSGKLEVNKPLLVTAYSGTIDTLYVKAGDEVDRGHKLVRLDGYVLDPNFDSQIAKRQQLQDDLDQAYDDLKDYTVTAPVGGIVTDLAIQANGAVQDGAPVCTIEQTTGFKLVVAVDELDIPQIRLGQKASVKIDALPGQQAAGEVVKISPVGVKANDVTTYDVTLKVDAPAGALANMSASTDIEVAFKAGALTVPVEALHTVSGKTYVYGALPNDLRADAGASGQNSGRNGGGMMQRFSGMFGSRGNANDPTLQRKMIEVTVGLVSDSSAEILSGLNEGDEIAVPIAQSSLDAMFNMGGSRSQGGNQSQNQPAQTSAAGDAKN